MGIELRDYQQLLYDGIRNSIKAGHKKILCVAPCGSGKTYLFAKIVENTKGEALVLTHRRELLRQTCELLQLNEIKARCEMILTEAKHLGEHQKPSLIITDEAHLSLSNSWEKVLDYYDTYTIGFTATPIRLDGKPLGNLYDDLVEAPTVNELIKLKRLSPVEYYAPMNVNTEGITIERGDFSTQELNTLMMDKGIYSDVWKSWSEIANGLQTIAYCVSIDRAEQTAEMFREHGVSAYSLSSKTPEKERERIMDDFRNGKFTVLCNVGIISEGISIDNVRCCLLLRPTESLALYWQQAMRCMRYLPNKVAIILDCVGNYSRNPMPTEDVEWSLERTPSKRKKFNECGEFPLRTCEKCFKVFEAKYTACPYCGHEYTHKPREIQEMESIELKKINEEEQKRIEAQRKEERKEQGRANNFEALVELGKKRGYKNPTYWAMQVMRGRKH